MRWFGALQRDCIQTVRESPESGLRVVIAMVFPRFAVVLLHATSLSVSCRVV